MNDLPLSLVSAILMGLGATLTFDLWAQVLKRAFQIPPSTSAWSGAGCATCRKAPLSMPILPPRRQSARNAWWDGWPIIRLASRLPRLSSRSLAPTGFSIPRRFLQSYSGSSPCWRRSSSRSRYSGWEGPHQKRRILRRRDYAA